MTPDFGFGPRFGFPAAYASSLSARSFASALLRSDFETCMIWRRALLKAVIISVEDWFSTSSSQAVLLRYLLFPFTLVNLRDEKTS